MPQIGYCTNVHAGPDLATTRKNLETHAELVKSRFSPEEPMGVGLWLAAPAAAELRNSEDDLSAFAQYLSGAGLVPFTLNGFPYGDFHQEVVKHAVYQPTWIDSERVEYTRNLFHIQHALLPNGLNGSISTLPIAWGDVTDDDALNHAARNLAKIATELAAFEKETGHCVSICIEPEPGCVMDRAEHIIDFFESRLLTVGDEQVIRRHLRVCHDICHSAVMFEEQAYALASYKAAGLLIGKVQVSSAVALRLDELDEVDRGAAIAQLSEFNEPRYLHQTMHRDSDGQLHFFEDLAPAIHWLSDASHQRGEVRVHFHVPIFLEEFGALQTTQSQVLECLQDVETDHFEVETYAWSVLPPELQYATLAEGIAEEMAWFRSVL